MKNNEEILIATSNKGKVKEFKKLFQTHNIFSLTDLGIDDAVEDGSSFLENALIKAKHGAKESKRYSISDDSGLVVPGLNFEPGIFSARYAGNKASDKENRDKIYRHPCTLKQIKLFFQELNLMLMLMKMLMLMLMMNL